LVNRRTRASSIQSSLRLKRNNEYESLKQQQRWGRFTQTASGGRQADTIELRYGKLQLKQLTLDAAPETKAGNATVKLDGADVAVQTKEVAGSTVIGFANDFKIAAGQTLQIKIN